MKAYEFSSQYTLTNAKVTQALQEIRGTDNTPSSSVKLTEREADQLRERFSLNTPVEKVDMDESELLRLEKEKFEADKAAFAEERDRWIEEQNSVTSKLDRIENALTSAPSPEARLDKLRHANNSAVVGKQIGTMVEVARGDLIIYIPNHRHPESTFTGGWFKCSESEEVTPDHPAIAVANKDFRYDSATGASVHSVDYKIHKRWLKAGGATLVSDCEPRPLIELPQLTV